MCARTCRARGCDGCVCHARCHGAPTIASSTLSPDEQAAIVGRAWQRDAAGTIGAIVRTAQDFATDGQAHPSLEWLDHVVSKAGDLGALLRIADAMPEHTLVLRDRIAAMQSTIVDLLGELAAQQPELTAQRAGALNNLATRLSALGRREDALAVAEEAVGLYRTLADQRPDAFRPNLAGSLNTLANRLRDLGRREDALAAAGEAVWLRRTLAAQRPDVFRPDLATSLMVAAQCFDAFEQFEEGMAANIEAIAILTDPYVRLPQAFASLMAAMVRQYLARCEKQGSEPDMALLGPVAAVFQRLQSQQEDKT